MKYSKDQGARAGQPHPFRCCEMLIVFFGKIEIHQTLGFNPGHFMYPGWKFNTSQPEFSVTSWPQLLPQASN